MTEYPWLWLRDHDSATLHPVTQQRQLHTAGVDTSLRGTATELCDGAVRITATVRTTGRTGVEMEALTAAATAALTLYNMVKSVQRDVRVEDLRLLAKRGGRSGEYVAT